ncbi:MAG: DEAD/DEAH box helicase family protein, partial [Clostridiales bacterium]|nr:DEAD/DEAH box helicase family protein [Clostridiales bacterium]
MIMQLTQFNNLARLDFKYNPTLTKKIKRIKGYAYNPDPLGPYWTVPIGSLSNATQAGILSPGYLSPHFLHLVTPDMFSRLSVEVKEDRLKISGTPNLLLIQSLRDLCSFEYIDKNSEEKYIIESLVKVGRNKNDIVILFPRGLYTRITTFLRHFRFRSYVEHPITNKPTKQLDIQLQIQPRPYQQQACEKINKGTISNRATLVMATGSGKTLLSAVIIAQLGVPCVFFTYSLDLLEQTAEVLQSALGIKVGKVGGRNFNIEPITVASIQTTYSCMERQDARWQKLEAYFNTVGCQFVDEGHMLGAETIFAIANKVGAYYSYALTATPHRDDGKEIYIEAATGPIVELITEKELVKQGYILPVQVEMYYVQHYPSRTKQYHKLYDKEIVDHWERTRKTVRAV